MDDASEKASWAPPDTVLRRGKFGKLVAVHRTIALLLLNSLLLFILANVAAGFYFSWKDRTKSWVGPGAEKKWRLAQVYPHMKEEEWRGLLRESWTRRITFEPYTQFKEGASQGTYVNVSEEGYRMSGRPQAWPPQAGAIPIFFFGGSTAFGYGVRDDETIASVLEAKLNGRGCSTPVSVYNFGRGWYYSSQERALFSRLLAGGVVPRLAIFLDGINEFTTVADEPAFTGQLRRWTERNTRGGRVSAAFQGVMNLSLFRAARGARLRLERLLGGSGPRPDRRGDVRSMPQAAPAIVERYLRNKAMIEGMAGRFSVETLFVWQPVPFYKYDRRLHLFDSGASGDGVRLGYRMLEDLRSGFAKDERKNFLWLADLQENKQGPLYVDMFHYTAAFSGEIAGRIGESAALRGVPCPGTSTGGRGRKGGA